MPPISLTVRPAATWVMVHLRQAAGQRDQETSHKDMEALYPHASSISHRAKSSPKSRGQKSVHLPGGLAESLSQGASRAIIGREHPICTNNQFCPHTIIRSAQFTGACPPADSLSFPPQVHGNNAKRMWDTGIIHSLADRCHSDPHSLSLSAVHLLIEL